MMRAGDKAKGHGRARRHLLPVVTILALTACILSHKIRGAEHNTVAWSLFGLRGNSSCPETQLERAKEVLLQSDAVFFDVDSTVVRTEGIDLLGRCFGVKKEISELTKNAMNGNVRFQDAMADRLNLMAEHGMTKERLEECVKTEGKPRWSRGIREVVKRLQHMGKDVYLVSGGFRNMIKPIAEKLNIPDDRVYANTILFDNEGQYVDFDRTAPTSRSGGKPAVLKAAQRENGYKTMVMLGDGATDLDARLNGPASLFIGYGGVSVRTKVKAGADWYIYNFQEILRVLPRSGMFR